MSTVLSVYITSKLRLNNLCDAEHKTEPTLYLLSCIQLHFFDIQLIYIFKALTPDQVPKLTAAVDPHKPSVTLNWDPPANAAGYVTKYEICFQDNNSGFHGEKVVNGSTTTTVITRESGLRPLTTFTFGVRAYSGDKKGREWRTGPIFVGM